MFTHKGHDQRFAKPFGFVVDAAHADGVYVAPIVLGLWMHLRVAVDRARRRHEHVSIVVQGQLDAVPGAQAGDVERFDRPAEIVLK